MNGIRPRNVYDDTMLPAVVRGDNLPARAVAGAQVVRNQPAGQGIYDSTGKYGYVRQPNNSPAPIKVGISYPKGMIVDIWV